MTRKVVRVVASFLALGLMVGCSSSPVAAPPLPSDTATTVPPPTVLPAQAKALDVAVPFSADDGALVVATGPGPVGVSSEDAEAVVRSVMLSNAPPSQPLPPHESLVGQVSLASGLGAPAMAGVPAWVMLYRGVAIASCAAISKPVPVVPDWASGLHALIVTSTDPATIVTYYGAGTGVCELRAKPEAAVAPDFLELAGAPLVTADTWPSIPIPSFGSEGVARARVMVHRNRVGAPGCRPKGPGEVASVLAGQNSVVT